MTYTTSITSGTYNTIDEAVEAMETEGVGQGGTIYDDKGNSVAELGPDGLIIY